MEFITSKKSIIASIIYVFFSISSYSQNTSSSEIFSKDYPVFLSELKDVLNVNANANAKKIYKKFLKNQEYYSDEERKKIIEISSYMFNKSYKINMYFYKFFEVLSTFSSESNNANLLKEWLNVCAVVIKDNSKKNMLNFFNFTIEFLETKNIYSSRLLSWQVDSDSFSFTNYSSQPVVTFFSDLNLSCTNSKGKI